MGSSWARASYSYSHLPEGPIEGVECSAPPMGDAFAIPTHSVVGNSYEGKPRSAFAYSQRVTQRVHRHSNTCATFTL